MNAFQCYVILYVLLFEIVVSLKSRNLKLRNLGKCLYVPNAILFHFPLKLLQWKFSKTAQLTQYTSNYMPQTQRVTIESILNWPNLS